VDRRQSVAGSPNPGIRQQAGGPAEAGAAVNPRQNREGPIPGRSQVVLVLPGEAGSERVAGQAVPGRWWQVAEEVERQRI